MMAEQPPTTFESPVWLSAPWVSELSQEDRQVLTELARLNVAKSRRDIELIDTYVLLSRAKASLASTSTSTGGGGKVIETPSALEGSTSNMSVASADTAVDSSSFSGSNVNLTLRSLFKLRRSVAALLSKNFCENGSNILKIGHKAACNTNLSGGSSSSTSASSHSEDKKIAHPSGIPIIDSFFNGWGIPANRIVEVLGAEGSGKTYLAMQLAICNAYSGKRVLVIDTHNNFIAKVLKERCNNYVTSRLGDREIESQKSKEQAKKIVNAIAGNIVIQKIFNYMSFIDFLSKLHVEIQARSIPPYDLIIVDDIYSLLIPLLDCNESTNAILPPAIHPHSSVSSSSSSSSSSETRPVVLLDSLLSYLASIMKTLTYKTPLLFNSSAQSPAPDYIDSSNPSSSRASNKATSTYPKYNTSIVIMNCIKSSVTFTRQENYSDGGRSREANRKGTIADRLYRLQTIRKQQSISGTSALNQCYDAFESRKHSHNDRLSGASGASGASSVSGSCLVVNPSEVRSFPSGLWSEILDMSILLSKDMTNTSASTRIIADVLYRPFYMTTNGYPKSGTFNIPG